MEFEVAEPKVEELAEGEPSELVLVNARWKAASIAATARPGTLVIGGDTEVALDGEVLGQPDDESQAREHLRRLSGREHEVFGAIALMGPGVDDEGVFEGREGIERTTVRFRELDGPLLDAYLGVGGVGGARGVLRDPGPRFGTRRRGLRRRLERDRAADSPAPVAGASISASLRASATFVR